MEYRSLGLQGDFGNAVSQFTATRSLARTLWLLFVCTRSGFLRTLSALGILPLATWPKVAEAVWQPADAIAPAGQARACWWHLRSRPGSRLKWRWATGAVLLLLVASAFAQPSLVVDWKAQRLSVSADRVPLAQVLREVARQTGIEVDGLDGLRERVSVRFANLPLREGLEKLLAHQDYAMMGDPSSQAGAPATVVVLGRSPSMIVPEKRSAARASNAVNDSAPASVAANDVAPPRVAPVISESGFAAQQDPAERAAALRDLADEGDTEALRKALLDPDPGVQAAAFEALAERDPHEAASLAADASRSNDLSRRLTGLFALGQIDEPIALSALEQSLADADDGIREYAVQSLRGQSSPQAAAALSRALQDPNPAIRDLALEALASRGADGRDALRAAMDSGDPQLKARAGELLEQRSVDEADQQ